MRKAMIAKIKIAQKQLQLDDMTYRGILTRVANKDSCTRCSLKELDAVLKEMKRLGFVATSPKHGHRPSPRCDIVSMMSKVEALLADSGLHWNYANALGKRMFGKEFVHWLGADELHKLIAALQIHANRKG